MLRRPALIALAIVLVVPLAACVESTRIPDAAPSSDEAPLFASDEEALAAATAAYEEVLAVSGEVLRDGGANPERLRPLVSESVYEKEVEGFDLFLEAGYFATGQPTVDGSELQQHTSGRAGIAEVQIYVCVSIESTDVVDSEGNSVADPSRPVRQMFEALFVSDAAGQLILFSESTWPSGGICKK